MKRRLLHSLAVLTVALPATAAVATTPASASPGPEGPICMLTQNTWLRSQPHGSVLRTLTAGRGFRVHEGGGVDNDVWLYGHGAEAPSQDGWIPVGNTTC